MKKILIVEDDARLQQALHDKLALEKFQVVQAHDGADGLVAALKEHPDLILLDIVMPQMDGISMLRELRKDPWGKSARVIVLSNLNDIPTVHEVLLQNTHDYLVKTDWSLKDIVLKINKTLK